MNDCIGLSIIESPDSPPSFHKHNDEVICTASTGESLDKQVNCPMDVFGCANAGVICTVLDPYIIRAQPAWINMDDRTVWESNVQYGINWAPISRLEPCSCISNIRRHLTYGHFLNVLKYWANMKSRRALRLTQRKTEQKRSALPMDEPTFMMIKENYFLKRDVVAARSPKARSGCISFARWNSNSSLST